MFIGLDLGTSGLKGILLDEKQTVIAEAHGALTVDRPHEGWSEQSPNDWVVAAETVLNALKAAQDLSAVKAIGLSGQMHGATLLDRSHEVLRPCILWNDTRSAEQAAQMDADADWRAISGNIVFPGFTAPKIAWVRENEPALFEKISKVLLPKDYLRFWLTGSYGSEMSDAAGTSWLDTGARDWSDKLLAKTGLTRDHMPTLYEGTDVSGTLRAVLAQRWGFSPDVIVAGGAGDNAASAIGTGVVKGGDAFVSLGTSGVLFAACDAYAPDAASAVHTFCHALPKTWHQMGVILSATDCLQWFGGITGQTAAQLDAQLGTSAAPGRALFLPYLGGERTPHNDAKVRGAMLGIEHASDHVALTRAVMEGVVHALRDNRDALLATGTHINQLIAVGGGSQSDYWLQTLATSLGVPVARPKDGDFGGAFGAARLAMIAHYGFDKRFVAKPDIAKVFEPDGALVTAFDEAHARYRRAYAAIRDF